MPDLITSVTPDLGIHPPSFRLPSTAHVGKVRLAVSDLARSVSFYSEIIGLKVASQEEKLAQLGAHGGDRVLLELEQVTGVEPIGRRSRLGLYHTAVLLPTREDLSRFVRHLAATNTAFGAGDHIYSEALYLTDPDGLTVEVYADRPRSEWQIDGNEIVSATNPVRFAEMPEVEEGSWRGAPQGTTIGHVHFYVGDLAVAAKFYNAGLGLDIVTWRYPGALFTSAGGYHHHVGLNVWAAGSPPASARDARMLFWELVLPDAETRLAALKSLDQIGFVSSEQLDDDPVVTDPWGIRVRLVVGDLS